MVAHTWRYAEPRAGAHSFFPILCNLSKGPSYSPSRPSTLFIFSAFGKQTSYECKFVSLTLWVAAISTNYVSLHLVNKSGPPDPSHPCKRQSLSWHGHGYLIALPGPRLRLSVSAILSRHRLSAPTLFFHGLPSRGEEGKKAKRNHFRRISHSHFPQGSGDRPKCRVAKIGRDGGLCGGAVPGGSPGVARICPRLRGFPPTSLDKRTWIVHQSCMVWVSKLKTVWDPAEVKECDIGASLASSGRFLSSVSGRRKGLLGHEAHGILAPLKLDKHPAHTQTTKVLYNLKDFGKLVASLFPHRSYCSDKGGLRQVSKRRVGQLSQLRESIPRGEGNQTQLARSGMAAGVNPVS